MSREPLELASREDLDWYAEMFGSDPEMMRLVRKCPDCDGAILACDNGWLDAKPAPEGELGVIKLGSYAMMAGGDVDGGSRHTLHAHQPGED